MREYDEARSASDRAVDLSGIVCHTRMKVTRRTRRGTGQRKQHRAPRPRNGRQRTSPSRPRAQRGFADDGGGQGDEDLRDDDGCRRKGDESFVSRAPSASSACRLPRAAIPATTAVASKVGGATPRHEREDKCGGNTARSRVAGRCVAKLRAAAARVASVVPGPAQLTPRMKARGRIRKQSRGPAQRPRSCVEVLASTLLRLAGGSQPQSRGLSFSPERPVDPLRPWGPAEALTSAIKYCFRSARVGTLEGVNGIAPGQHGTCRRCHVGLALPHVGDGPVLSETWGAGSAELLGEGSHRREPRAPADAPAQPSSEETGKRCSGY